MDPIVSFMALKTSKSESFSVVEHCNVDNVVNEDKASLILTYRN